jgi:hypothetical protein
VIDSSTSPNSATVSLLLTVTDGVSATPPQFAITTASLAIGQVGLLYSQTLTASAGTGLYTWSLAPGSTLPNGLALNPSTGQIGGTPTSPANTSITFLVTDSSSPAQTATKVLTLVVATPGGRDQR